MKQYFKHSLPTDDIVIRQDVDSNSEFFEKNIGQLYPLIRIKEQTINFPEIVSFNLSCGVGQFLPVVDITIDDAEFIFRESNFIQRGDILTIWVGNGQDTEHEVVKNNYYILDVSSTPGSQFVNLTCVLNVPELWKPHNRVFDLDTVSILKKIAKECQLGFVSNIEESNDQMSWIQHTNTYSFIQNIVAKSFVNSKTTITVFIDQFGNLNVMDLQVALNDRTKTELTTQPITGKKLDEPVPLYASNSSLGTDIPKAQIISWTPTTQYGLESLKFTAQIEATSQDPIDQAIVKLQTPILNPQLKKSSLYTTFINEAVHENYAIGKVANINNLQLLQNIKIQATLDYYIPVLFLGMQLPVEIWNLLKNEQIHTQDPLLNEKETEDKQATGPSRKHHKNEQMSGDTILLNLNIGYNRKATVKSETKFIRQAITVMKKEGSDT